MVLVMKTPRTKLTVKIVRVTDYFQRAVNEFGKNEIFKNALAIIYSENEIKDKFERKGEVYLIIEPKGGNYHAQRTTKENN